jgi:hypothetical protein
MGSIVSRAVWGPETMLQRVSRQSCIRACHRVVRFQPEPEGGERLPQALSSWVMAANGSSVDVLSRAYGLGAVGRLRAALFRLDADCVTRRRHREVDAGFPHVPATEWIVVE